MEVIGFRFRAYRRQGCRFDPIREAAAKSRPDVAGSRRENCRPSFPGSDPQALLLLRL